MPMEPSTFTGSHGVNRPIDKSQSNWSPMKPEFAFTGLNSVDWVY